MTGKQNAVMWLGLLLVAARLFATSQWSTLWSVVGTESGSAPAGGTGDSVSGNGYAGTTTLPPAKKGAPTITLPTSNPAANPAAIQGAAV